MPPAPRAALLLLGVALAAGTEACRPPAPVAAAGPLALGDALADLSAPDTLGRHRPLREWIRPGRLLLVSFWSALCPCSAACDETLVELLRTHGERLAVVGIASAADEPAALVAAVQRDRRLPFPILLDPSGRLAARLGAVATPTVLLFDDAGRLRYRGDLERADPVRDARPPDVQLGSLVGWYDEPGAPARPPVRRFAADAIEALLAGRPPPAAEVPTSGCAIERTPP